MTDWKSNIDLDAPCWDGYREFLQALPGDTFPDFRSLQACLPSFTSSGSGHAIRFLAATDLPGVDYERHIFETGQVSTRENNWHDLFNALAWCRLPLLKSAMNSLHYENLGLEKDGSRGRLRDALTLLDESGVIVSGSNVDALNALACRDWTTAFVTCRGSWGTELQVLVCGHAILEKFLDPYKSVTAHALLLHTPDLLSAEEVDRFLGPSLARPGWLASPSGLSPLPLMGIPRWWTANDQDDDFYHDYEVFRPASGHKSPAPVHTYGKISAFPDPEHMKNQPRTTR
jgi:hypothetical protein